MPAKLAALSKSYLSTKDDTAAMETHVQQATSHRRSQFVVDPRKSEYIPIWDAITAFALIFTVSTAGLGSAPRYAVSAPSACARDQLTLRTHTLSYARRVPLNALQALVTPYEVAFLPKAGLGLFAINRIVDLIFFMDLVLQFFLAVPTSGRQLSLIHI